ncbi:universal stress protein [Halonotius terrestris]|uniref:Universal stress protein n=1 Tax=Halonotius terrestris TaxID=2487750 RepID=A0A8J8TD83_9EURY|nr:universal stress protein [Halonotius terrestris]TQQ82939.1 universal stress protein [Halonotius terrestris]
MIAVSDARAAEDTTRSYGPCLLGSISGETARGRGAAVAHALATARNTDLLLTESIDSADELPQSHRTSHSQEATTLNTAMNLEPVVSEQSPSVAVLERQSGPSFLSDLRANTAERLADETDVLTVDGRGQTDTIASILVPIAGGRHSQLAVEAARAIAEANDAALDLFHVIEADGEADRERGEQILATAATAIGDFESVDTWLYEAESAADAIIDQSSYYDLTVMGAPTVGPLERFVFGSTSTNVQQEADSPIVVAHAHSP